MKGKRDRKGPFFLSTGREAVLILKLAETFFQENAHLVEVLDKNKRGQWDGEKERGYGLAVISHKNLRFGIPLRTNISHSYCYRTSADKGLDYTKAVLLLKESYITDRPFMIDNIEFLKIKEHSHHISVQFGKFVDRYVSGITHSDANILRAYKYSTLQNYHRELGLP